MTTRNAGILVIALLATAWTYADGADDRTLIAQAATERQAAAPAKTPAETASPETMTPAAPADELGDLEQKAALDVVVSQARLELIQARKALRAKRFDEAVLKARSVLATLRRLPADLDLSTYELQAEGIIARATRATQGAVTLSDAPAPKPNTQPAQPAAVRDSGYCPGRPIINVNAIAQADDQRLVYDGALTEAYKADEAARLTDVDESRLVGGDIVTYPENWPEIVAKRAKYKDGVIARGPSLTDAGGREWYVAVYDINDLIYVPPDFAPAIGLTPAEELRNVQDRDAIRAQSQIFSGWPEDLAAGIPLLRFFGGVDDFEYRGPKYSAEKQKQIIEMVKAFTATRNFEPTVDAVGP